MTFSLILVFKNLIFNFDQFFSYLCLVKILLLDKKNQNCKILNIKRCITYVIRKFKDLNLKSNEI